MHIPISRVQIIENKLISIAMLVFIFRSTFFDLIKKISHLEMKRTGRFMKRVNCWLTSFVAII